MTTAARQAGPGQSRRPRVIVVGGGLAGMAAAVALESAGCAVTLLESRKSLGGRAGSFQDPQTGIELDNCQHVLLGCCTNLIDFYRRIGALGMIRFERAINLTDKSGRRFALGSMRGLPAPLHLAASLLQESWLNWSQRLSLARAMTAIMQLGRDRRDRLSNITFGEWLDRHRQPESLLRLVFDPILISALNERTRDAAASFAIQVLYETLLANRRGCALGLPNCTLAQLYASFIDAPPGRRDVRLGCRVNRVRTVGNAAIGVELQDGEILDSDAVVLAIHHANAIRQLPAEAALRDRRFVAMQGLVDVPILGAHLWFDRSVFESSHTGLIDGPLQWLFRKDDRGCVVHGVISAARDWVDVPRERCGELFEQQLRSTFAAARDAKLLRCVVVVEKRATFAPIPRSDESRPSQAPPDGGLQNLYLAGDYTKTGWPATMEGAVRSGYLAAETVARRLLGRSPRFVVDDLVLEWPAHLMSSRAISAPAASGG
jgi:squalene-associated FAD-dependent desaturase